MHLAFHPGVSSDVRAIMEYYREVAGPELAEEFYREFRQLTVLVARQPGRYATREHGLRRANLPHFPYHFLFRVADDSVRVLVVRHHRRRPSFGTRRR